MTFPVVATTGYSEEGVDTTTHDVVVPSGISAGDLLILMSSIDLGSTEPTMTGWTKGIYRSAAAHAIGVWYKFASGSETNFTYTTSASQQSANLTWRVTGAHASSPPEGFTAYQDSFVSIFGANSMTPSWGAEDTMWVVMAGSDSSGSITAYPTNYTDNQFYDNSGGSAGDRAGIVVCSRNLNTTTEDPGDGTYNTSTNQCSTGFAIRPAAAGAGATTLDPFGMSGFFGA